MKFFDCNFQIGYRAVSEYRFPANVSEGISVMDTFGIDRALISNYNAVTDPDTYNAELIKESAQFQDRIIPCLTYLPYSNSPGLGKDVFLSAFISCRAGGIVLRPEEGRFSLVACRFDPFFAICNRLHIPVFIQQSTEGPFLNQVNSGELEPFLALYPDIPTVLLQIGYRTDRNLFALMDRFKNLYIEISTYQAHMQVECFVKRFSSKRILFGSHFPVYSPGCGMYKLETAELTAQEVQDIAYNNLTQMLEVICYDQSV